MAVSPTTLARVGSGYGPRASRLSDRTIFHAGWDFVAPRGTHVFAAEGGRVVMVSRDEQRARLRGYGNAIVIAHPDQTYALYAHLSRADVREGDAVATGQQLGLSGSSTNGQFPRMGPHLHLEIRHARSDSSSPFPGAYGQLGIDPKDWFADKGMSIANRWGGPPGTLVPMGSGVEGVQYGGAAARLGGPVSEGGRFHSSGLEVEWWETVFHERAPAGEEYEPGVDQVGGPLWEWSGVIAGFLVFNGVYFLMKRELPILRLEAPRRL